MPASVNGDKLNLHSRLVAPAYFLDANSVGELMLGGVRRGSDAIDGGEILTGCS